MKAAGFSMARMSWKTQFLLVALFVGALTTQAQTQTQAPSLPFSCSFAKGGWDAKEWILVKSPRWDHFGQWLQKEDHIQNETPDVKEEDKLGKSAPDTYTSMVYGKKFSGNVVITTTGMFTFQMAPLVVIAPELGQDDKGRPEYREHFEIVFYDKGVNVWHHSYKDKKPSWVKAAYCAMDLKPNQKYTMSVKKKGKELSVTIDGKTFGYRDESLPEEFHVGVTGCEGDNRFYDFKIEKL